MKVSRLVVNNYKAFESFELKFEEDINVLYGLNGTGKSTVLRCVTMLLQLINTKAGVASNFTLIKSSDYFEKDKDVSISIEVDIDNQKKKFGILKPSTSYGRDSKINVAPEAQQQPVMVNIFQKNALLADGTRFTGDLNFFEQATVLAHHNALFPGNNIPTLRPPSTRIDGQMEIQFEFATRFASVRGITNLKGNIDWFNKKESLEQQMRLEEGNFNYRDPALETMRNALVAFDDSFSGIKIDRRITAQPLTVCKNGKYLELDSLSDGEGTLVSILLLMSSLQEQVGSNNATIIIDEIDTSLHPTWQSEIIHRIHKSFSNWQIIASSHSPFVWSRLEKRNVRNMVRQSEGRIATVDVAFAKGSSVESIVAEFFGVAGVDSEVQTLIDEIEMLIANKDGKAAREQINALRAKYGNLPVLTRFEAKIIGLAI